MLKQIVLLQLNRVERRLGGSVEYLRFILRTSFGAFVRCARVFSISKSRGPLPAEPYHLARILGARSEGCGECIQIEVDLARRAGVPEDLLEVAVLGAPDRLPEDLRVVYSFAEALAEGSGELAASRDGVVRHYGEEGLIELTLAFAVSRFPPLLKRALGYANACEGTRIRVSGGHPPG